MIASIRSRLRSLAFGLLITVAGVPASAAEDPDAAFFSQPRWLGQNYIGLGEWAQLEALVDKLATSRERSADGQFQLYLMTEAIYRFLEAWGQRGDESFRAKADEYQGAFPDSAFAPLFAAMQLHTAAWRARGHGYTNSVAKEGWELFAQRNRTAWQVLQAAKSKSDRLPTWYELSIAVGMDAKVDKEQIDAIFEEGVKRFPGYYAIYRSYLRQFSPYWGGSYVDVDKFIKDQVAMNGADEGDSFYTRLYWMLEDIGSSNPTFFEDSLVSWPRMRDGFEMLMTRYPKGEMNRANFAAFACRAGDMKSYLKWHENVDLGYFRMAAPQGLSPEVCDAKFSEKM